MIQMKTASYGQLKDIYRAIIKESAMPKIVLALPIKVYARATVVVKLTVLTCFQAVNVKKVKIVNQK